MNEPRSLIRLAAEIVSCRACPRLVAWREEAAARPPRRFRGQRYWARPVPGFGDPGARLLVVGLAPAAHGGNRTGRVFTGDASGDFLFAALHAAGFASQPVSVSREDGLAMRDAWIEAAVRCAPPDNRPTPLEFATCRPFLDGQIDAVQPRVIVALGKPAASLLLGRDVAITRARGTWHAYRGIPVMPTFHPAFVLRQYTAENRRLVWSDLKAALERSRQ